ncbi:MULTISPECIES: DUF2235 domain-containing protein [unclassified Xanthobacter]|uniref:DUF2235 domain-containing protein n=1 Tax=unclassified Xanthobacter TaxID=2623496 RepID=UPI001EDF070A|nr:MULTISPECIES: DUF2235 domain-containing protein [unclassified Xanthobacter]
MGRNIVIFSDGTAQAGGITFDERRSNIYKLYRATRCGPDSIIDPKDQTAFYDPGLGSALDGDGPYRGILRGPYTLISKATGFGITANIIDCYAALIRMWQPGDRIFLFGFSRGAYTVRCLSGVIRWCGIPTRMPDGSPLPLDGYGSRKLATQAVKQVYQFTTSRPKPKATPRQLFLLNTREQLAARFRAEHGSADPDDPDRPNVMPYFIGVFDTVAALLDPPKFAVLLLAVVLACVGLVAVLSVYFGISPGASILLTLLAALLCGVLPYLFTHLKFTFSLPDQSLADKLRTLHLTDLVQTFADTSLDGHVPYAKHALSIDENRAAFARVPWASDYAPALGERDGAGHIRFEQVWFAGVHSDVGGSYAEDESRLSDIPLQWMLDWATGIPNGLLYDPTVLRLYPDPSGLQHDARREGFGLITRWFRLTYGRGDRNLDVEAILHPTVYDRLDAATVGIYDHRAPYRPGALGEHKDSKPLYELRPGAPPCKVARSRKCELPPSRAPQPGPTSA